MAAPLYICTLSSSDTADLKTYQTHHRKTDAPHHAVDVHSDYSGKSEKKK
jgi:hypothetical protein